MNFNDVAALNPIGALGMMFGDGIANLVSHRHTKMLARYLGKTEYYDKVTDCPPITLYHGRIYQISVQPPSTLNNGWTIVRIYDHKGRYLTWIPYSVDYRRFWDQV